MIKKTFKYCTTHKEDEAYMQEMVSQGWAALRLVEGFWTFEPCKPGEYCYRICYLRGKTAAQIEEIKEKYAAKGIEFVSRYSFWAIFRSKQEFRLYSAQEDLEICRKIYAPMPIGAVVSWVVFLASVVLVWKVSPFFWILTVLVGVYGGVCTWLGISYKKLLKEMERNA